MKKINIKEKPKFLNNNQFLKLRNFNLEFEETINPHAIWLQTMEPTTYAKNNKKNLYIQQFTSINKHILNMFNKSIHLKCQKTISKQI